jgi:hypothetical protein
MRYAILLGNHEMFQVILEAVKEACGQNSFLDLLKTEKEDRRFSSRFDNSILTPKKLWKTKVKVLLQNDRKKGYKDLFNLVYKVVGLGTNDSLEEIEEIEKNT